MNRPGSLDRRGVLGLMGGGAAIAAGSASATVAPATPGPVDPVKAYMSTYGALDDRVLINVSTGRYYGVVDAEMTPFHDIAALLVARHRPHPGGGYEIVSLEQAYYTDIETGRVLKTLRNPYTGETVDVPPTGAPPSTSVLLANGQWQAKPNTSGLTVRRRLSPIVAQGPGLSIATETTMTRPAAGPNPAFRYHEFTMAQVLRRDLEAPGAKHVDCAVSFNAVLNWRPWMNMADRPGDLLVIANGRSGADLNDASPGWLEETANVWPALLTDPGAALDKVWEEGVRSK